MRKYILAVAAGLLCLAACRHEEEPFSFNVSSPGCEEGQALPVSVTITKGAREGYTLSCLVESYDLRTGTGTPVDAALLSGTGRAPASGVDFTDSGHRDFTIVAGNGDFLPAGTYRINVSLGHGDRTENVSCVATVCKGETPDVPDEPKTVTGITLPSAKDGFTVETSGGFDYIVLDLKDYGAGKGMTFRCTVTPADAANRTITASSDTPSVATAAISDGTLLTVVPVSEGRAVVTVKSADGGLSRAFGVKVVDTSVPPAPPTAEDFTIPSVDKTYGKVPVTCGTTFTFTPVVTPSDADPGFSATSSDPSVADVSVSGGTVTVTGKYPGYASITLSAKDGPSKTFPVMVYKEVLVRVEWYELEPSDSQLKSKTFPCKLKFSSDSDVAFPSPVTWTVSTKAVVTVAGQDAKSVSDNRDVPFYGNKAVYYDLTTNLLLPAWQLYRTNDFGLSVTLSLQRNAALDPDIWRVTYEDAYKTQDARIKTYLTEIQQ